ncbi:MAG: Ig-like domain-containing protein [Deltaproteobacteria bacterium]|nr:Ig-like domain-containing protein [Deltaproteobacteria bacterium]
MATRQTWKSAALGAGLLVALVGAAISGACSAGNEAFGVAPGGGGQSGTGGSGLHGGGGAGFNPDGGDFDGGTTDASTVLAISPQDPVLTVVTGQPVPTVTFQVLNTGSPVPALWLVDRGEIASIDKTGLLTPTGKVAGKATVEATVGKSKLTTSVTVKIQTVQNGADQNDPPPGSGGWGGVGGEGVGPAVDGGLVAVLEGAPSPDGDLRWLYPYDLTVWPTGILPPLLQWTAGVSAAADAVLLHLYCDYYDYKGFFGRPAALAPGAPFVRHPAPPATWKAATLSCAGGTLAAEIVVAKGAVAYGPIAETWLVAKGQLKGTVYYQSYGTKLAKNYYGGIGGDGKFGGATLVIKPGATDPALVAGKNGGTPECRVCHSVSADGSRMVVQHGNDYKQSSSYDLKNGYTESVYGPATSGNLGWIGMLTDGSKGLGNRVPLPGGANPNAPSTQLYELFTGTALPAVGLAEFVTRAGFPAFSVDSKHVAFNFYAGPGNPQIGPGDGKKLVAMDFDVATNTFSNPKQLYTGANAPGWPSFLPTNDAVVFQISLPGASEYFATRYGGRGQLWWADLGSGTAAPLDRLNGKQNGQSYLPVGPGNHADDTVLQYEPTVSPIPSGGYAWVVFLSRRTYGNVATIDPWWSDPREHDLTQTPTTKKLWVAAVDLNAKPGTDPSHPAFYLPGQELLAGNARGYWVNVPCRADGEPCESGDECCGGFCQPDPVSGDLVCGQKGNECSAEFEKCSSDLDCCDELLKCINGICVHIQPH